VSLDEIRELAREVSLAVNAERCAVGRWGKRFGEEALTPLTEGEQERLIFDVLDRKLWTP